MERARLDREKWDRRYAAGRVSPLRKTLVRFYRLARVGRALEIACGTGANAIFLARRGFRVDALDISEAALRRARRLARRAGVSVNFIVCDAARFAYPPETYDLVLNFYFLDPRIFPGLRRTLKPGGLLIFETRNLRHLARRPHTNPVYLLRPCELSRAFAGFEVVYYAERDAVTTLVARKPLPRG